MNLLGKLKAWAIAAGVAVGLVLTAIAMVFRAGKRQEKADTIIRDRIQEEKVDDRIQDAVDEGRRVDDALRADDGVSGDLRADDGFKRTAKRDSAPKGVRPVATDRVGRRRH